MLKPSSIFVLTLSLALLFIAPLVFVAPPLSTDDPIKSEVYSLDTKLRDLELLFRSELDKLWGEFHRELCKSLIELNGTPVTKPNVLWDKVLHLDSWAKNFYKRESGPYETEVDVRADVSEVSSAGSLDPAKIVWLYPKADIETEPWEWILNGNWRIVISKGNENRVFSDSQRIPVPLRPRAHVRSVLEFYDYVLQTPPFLIREPKVFEYLPTHEELMQEAKLLAEDALNGREGLAYFVTQGRRATESKYVMKFAVFGNKTWYYEISSFNISRRITISVKEVKEEESECNVTYKVKGYGQLNLTMSLKLVGNVTPIEVYQIGCADCDAFFYRASVEKFRRARLIYETEGTPKVLRVSYSTVRTSWGVSEEASGCVKDEVVNEVREAIAEHLDHIEARVRNLIGQLFEEREKNPIGFEEFLIPEDFVFSCMGN